jgi:ATP-dependent exoDNAse (exonuclease V) beta subunit
VDLAYDSGAGFVVIDFKTDKPDTQLLERYRRQVALYAAAIEHATGRAARPVLMTI